MSEEVRTHPVDPAVCLVTRMKPRSQHEREQAERLAAAEAAKKEEDGE